MRLAISNIAWDVSEDEAIASLLNRFGVDAIDIAPGKYFPDPASATDEETARVKSWWAERGIEITGMQALLFSTVGLNIFGSSEIQDELLHYLTGVCRIGSGLGATRLVFGSPKNRDRSGLSDEESMEIAVRFFRRLGDIAQSYSVLICLEPNPASYGSNFMTTSAETAKVVEQTSHLAIRMQLDTGALAINDEDVAVVLRDYSSLIGHIHASEPELLTLCDGEAKHAVFAEAIKNYLPNHLVTIEMLASKNEPHILAVERALAVAIEHYRNVQTGVSV